MQSRVLFAALLSLTLLAAGCTGATDPVETTGSGDGVDAVVGDDTTATDESGSHGTGSDGAVTDSSPSPAPDLGLERPTAADDRTGPFGDRLTEGFDRGTDREGPGVASETPSEDLQTLPAIRGETLDVPAEETVSRTLQVVADVVYRIEAVAEGDADVVVTIIGPDGSQEVVDNSFSGENESRRFQVDGEATFQVSAFDGQPIRVTLTVDPA